jgi:hypothetical protein
MILMPVLCLRCHTDPVMKGDKTKVQISNTTPNRNPPFTGTRWQVTEIGPDAVTLRCLGALEGPRFRDGRTQNGSVGLAANTNPPFTGTRWRVRSYPVCIDEPCGDCQ